MSDLNAILTQINSSMTAQSDPRLVFSSAYTYSTTGSISGNTSLSGYVSVWSMTDVMYLQDIVPVVTGTWTSSAGLGIKMIENAATSSYMVVTAGNFVAGTTYKIVSIGTTDFTLVGASSNTIGLSFVATGAGTGTGTASTINASGTISCSTNVVTGVGTLFTTEAQVGGTLYVNNERRYIQSIQSDTQLTLWVNLSTAITDQTFTLIGPPVARTISNGTPPSLPVSFKMPVNDPDTDQSGLGTKNYTYDAALFLLVCAQNQNFTVGNGVVDALNTINAYADTNLGTVGAMPFSANAFNLSMGDMSTIRSGTAAWVGMALCEYYKVSNYAPALTLATKIGTYLLSRQVSRFAVNDRRGGLVTLGQNGLTISTQVSTEHNIDSYFFFKALYPLSQNIVDRQAYLDIQYGLLNNLYDGTLNRFLQGTSATNGDYGEALDVYSWGGCFLLDSNEHDKAVAVAIRMLQKFYVSGKTTVLENNYPTQFNQTYTNATVANGMRTYAVTTDGDVTTSYVSPPNSIWQEGTQGALLFLNRLNNATFLSNVSDLAAGQDIIYNTAGNGDIIEFTSSSRLLPYEFQVWPALAAGCWWWLRSVASSLLFPSAAQSTTSTSFSFPGFTQAQVQTQGVVYLNETRLKPTQWSVIMNGTTPTIVVNADLLRQGDLIRAVVNPYSPTAKDLAFDPTVSDTNPFILTQYKNDYPYVLEVLRDVNDALTVKNYYYWAKNKTTIGAVGQLSTADLTQLLTDNTDLYAVPQTLKFYNQLDGRPNRYSTLAVRNLGREVTSADRYKLRLSKDQTLRDRDENITIKPVFTEWQLLRRGQLDLIPLELWNKLVDTMCASTQLNLPLPYAPLALYDKKNGTSVSYGLDSGQVMTDADLAIATVKYTIQNTQVDKYVNGQLVPDYISYTPSPAAAMYGTAGVFNVAQLDAYLSTSTNIRTFMADLWRFAKPPQVNEIFFNVLQDMAAKSLEMDTFFKTSFISLNEIRTATATGQKPTVAISSDTASGQIIWDFEPNEWDGATATWIN